MDFVKARRLVLAKPEESGETEGESSYTNAIDGWISILDNRKALDKARKEAQGQKTRNPLSQRHGGTTA